MRASRSRDDLVGDLGEVDRLELACRDASTREKSSRSLISRCMRSAAFSIRARSAAGSSGRSSPSRSRRRSPNIRILRSGSCRSCEATDANCSSSSFERASSRARSSAAAVRSATRCSSVAFIAVSSAFVRASLAPLRSAERKKSRLAAPATPNAASSTNRNQLSEPARAGYRVLVRTLRHHPPARAAHGSRREVPLGTAVAVGAMRFRRERRQQPRRVRFGAHLERGARRRDDPILIVEDERRTVAGALCLGQKAAEELEDRGRIQRFDLDSPAEPGLERDRPLQQLVFTGPCPRQDPRERRVAGQCGTDVGPGRRRTCQHAGRRTGGRSDHLACSIKHE